MNRSGVLLILLAAGTAAAVGAQAPLRPGVILAAGFDFYGIRPPESDTTYRSTVAIGLGVMAGISWSSPDRAVSFQLEGGARRLVSLGLLCFDVCQPSGVPRVVWNARAGMQWRPQIGYRCCAFQAGLGGYLPVGRDAYWRAGTVGLDIGMLIGYPERHRYSLSRLVFLPGKPGRGLILSQMLGHHFSNE